jgi:hypothetical protein
MKNSSELEYAAKCLSCCFGRLHHEVFLVKMLERAGISTPQAWRHVDARRNTRMQPEVVAVRRGRKPGKVEAVDAL